MRPLRLLGLLAVLAFGAPLLSCASSGTRGTSMEVRQADLLDRAEMDEQQWADSYALVEALRPRWLRTRGMDSIQGEVVEVQLYVGGQRVGTAAQLRNYPVHDVERMQFLPPVEASARYGMGHTNGAILVTLRQGS